MILYKDRYEFEEIPSGWVNEAGLVAVYDGIADQYVRNEPFRTIDEALKGIENYEDNLAEAAWYRSTQDGESKAERDERHHNYQNLK